MHFSQLLQHVLDLRARRSFRVLDRVRHLNTSAIAELRALINGSNTVSLPLNQPGCARSFLGSIDVAVFAIAKATEA